MFQTRFATVVSYLFHPLLIPTIGTFLILNLGGYLTFTLVPTVKYMVLGIVFLNTFIFPFLSSYYLLKKGLIKSYGMASIQERKLPLLLTAIFYFFTYYILRHAVLPPMLFLMILGATLAILLTLIITLAWKISTHMVGMGGLLGAVIGVSIKFSLNLQILVIGILLLSGLVGYARLKLRVHSHPQVYWGFVIGLFSMMLLMIGI